MRPSATATLASTSGSIGQRGGESRGGGGMSGLQLQHPGKKKYAEMEQRFFEKQMLEATKYLAKSEAAFIKQKARRKGWKKKRGGAGRDCKKSAAGLERSQKEVSTLTHFLLSSFLLLDFSLDSIPFLVFRCLPVLRLSPCPAFRGIGSSGQGRSCCRESYTTTTAGRATSRDPEATSECKKYSGSIQRRTRSQRKRRLHCQSNNAATTRTSK